MTPLYTLAAETKTVHIQDKNMTWNITVANCDIDTSKEVVVVKRSLPSQKVVIRQGGKVQRCDVKRINVLIA